MFHLIITARLLQKWANVELSVPEKNLSTLVFSLDTNMGDIDIPDELNKKVVSTDNNASNGQKSSHPQNHLTVKSDYGDISIRHS